jgi:HD superfamily phosphohydrolase
MDRLDYLKRDSFYTGVAEGNTNAERLITMLNVVDGSLVVEEKGIYSVEKFLMARRFMYWQVYLHKTGVAAEQLLINILKRARYLIDQGQVLRCSDALSFFLGQHIDKDNFDTATLGMFSKLDDVDILSALKEWQYESDFVLSELCKMIINRKLLHVKIKKEAISEIRFQSKFEKTKMRLNLTDEETAYFVFKGIIENKAYDRKNQNINILRKNGKITDVAKMSDHLNLNALSKTVTKYYICYPKEAV